MASTSSPTTPSWKHDVFLSFRGTDTRNSFTSHLHAALQRNQIDAYIDNKLDGGEKLEPALLEKIEDSYISVVIFSENYADSTFCLRELSKIHECMETKGQKVLPVFHQLDPSQVQDLTGSYGKALSRHKRKCAPEEVKRWRHALKEIANLKGWDSNVIKDETRLIEEIVSDIQKKFKNAPSTSIDTKGHVGMQSRVKHIESLLSFGSTGVLTVGIWGMGGIGKSTTAEAVYNRNSYKFEGLCFYRNVREESENNRALHVRQEILREVLEMKDRNILTTMLPEDIMRMLQRKKVLIVLDDVKDPKDLKILVGEDGCLFGEGSRIIVTSRDRQVLINACQEKNIYEVPELDEGDALRLFSFHAFKQSNPPDEFTRLSENVVRCVKGIPLVLEVLGASLFKKTSVEYWESKVAQLRKNGGEDILKMCYHDLDQTEKKIFLDIACFFVWYTRDYLEQTLDLEERSGIDRLIDMCLIKIVQNEIWMHDVLLKLGRKIVLEENRVDPRERSRLWDAKDVYRVLREQGTGKVESIYLNVSEIKEINLSPAAFEGMCNLRLLKFYYPTMTNIKRVRIHLPQGLHFLSNELRILDWCDYPLKSLPSNFFPEKLAVLEMPGSQLEQLWNEYKPLENLKLMNLRFSSELILSDFSNFPNLDVLNLTRCSSCLVGLFSSNKHCTKLTILELSDNESLCTLPSSIGFLSQLVKLDLSSCSSLTCLPDSIGELKSLEELDLHCCSKLVSLPSSIGKLTCLVKLKLSVCCELASLPESIGELKSLEELDLYRCSKLASLLNICGLKSRKSFNLGNYPRRSEVEEIASTTNKLGCLQHLNMESCGVLEIPRSIGSWVSLKIVIFSCNNFERIPANIKQLPMLIKLDLHGCERLQYLPQLPSSLQVLNASDCISLKSVAGIFMQGKKDYEAASQQFNFSGCLQLHQNSLTKIIGDAHLRIKHMTTSLFNQQYFGKPIRVQLCIPGLEVPEWFTYKNTGGPSLKIKLPAQLNCANTTDQLFGLTLCAVVSFGPVQKYCRGFDIKCECHLITKDGTQSDLSFHCNKGELNMRSSWKREHVFIWSINSSCFFKEASFHFTLLGEITTDVVVLQSGVHPLFVEDYIDDAHNDVFLSFRDKDTRYGFTSHLHNALQSKHIDAYIDKKLDGGEKIEPALLKRIEDSYISVVIFSENYADSTFCLRELSKIHECMKTKGQMVLPVFHKLDPSQVQNLTGSYGKALSRHERKCASEEVESWRHASKEIANLKVWDSSVIKDETRLIEEIVSDIQKKLKNAPSASIDAEGLVGMQSRVKHIESLLYFGSTGVLTVGIWGMGGIGKSTTAEAVYNRNSHKFEGRCFFPNVREESKKHGINHVRKKILGDVLENKDLKIYKTELPPGIKRMLQRKKVLIVLDDVSDAQDLKFLVGEDGLFGEGSRIIVTSRDKQVLINACQENKIYEVTDLDEGDAIRLFSLHAFEQNNPPDGYTTVSKTVVSCVKGIPLVLEVLGASLYKKTSVEYWKSKAAQLRTNGGEDIKKCLAMCYDELDRTEKKIFLDIACFFGRCPRDYLQQTLDLEERSGIDRLIDMCLIKIVGNEIWMHDVLLKLGRDIVTQENDDPRKRSRLWDAKDVYRVLTTQGTGKVESISLDVSETKEINLSPAAFEGMYNLRLLKFYHPYDPYDPYYLGEERDKIHLPRGLHFLSNELRILYWCDYPLKSLPSNFFPEKLVVLEMPRNQLEHLWNDYQPLLENLKLMDLSWSSKLILSDFDFSNLPNLEVLNLGESEDGLHANNLCTLPPSIGSLSQLVELDLSFCASLTCLPDSIGELKSLVELNLQSCSKLASLPSSIGKLKCLVKLMLDSCSKLASLPESIGELKSLVKLYITYCSKLSSLPDSIGELKCLAKLHLNGCSGLASLPDSIGELKCLAELYLYGCSKLASLPDNIGELKCLAELYLNDCSKLASLPNSIYGLESLKSFNLYRCYKLNGFPSLNLRLPRNDFERIPATIKQFPMLIELNLYCCESLQHLPQLPSSLRVLIASDCISLTSVEGIFMQGCKDYEAASQQFNFSACLQLDQNSLTKIIGDARLRIQRMVTSLLNQQYFGKPISVRLCIPGSEVPEWFTYKNTRGPTVKIKLPAHWHRANTTDQLFGFTLCAVVSFGPCFFADFDIKCECHLITKDGTHSDLSFHYYDGEGWGTWEREHVFIWSIHSDLFFKEASFHFKLLGKNIARAVVQSGVNPLFVEQQQRKSVLKMPCDFSCGRLAVFTNR